jgi:ABC-type multidrug transport system ATPase subunit
MSEEILKALMQLFAIIAKQDEGVENTEKEYVRNFLSQQLSDELSKEYYALFEKHAEWGDEEENTDGEKKKRLTKVNDSVRILGICRKINKTLTQNQKVVALVRLFELVNADRKFSEQRMAIINTVSEVFNVVPEEFKSIEKFVIQNEPENIDDPLVLVINSSGKHDYACKHLHADNLDKNIFILHIPSVELYFLKYTGEQDLFLNGLSINNKRIYLFASGSSVKLPKAKPIYYSDVAAHFLADIHASKISFEVKDLEYKFSNGNIGLRNVNFCENHGRLVGIMGASGAGKTTLLNVLCGIEKPSSGQVLINGVNLHTQKKEIEGVIGLIPQDDLLIEDLTVFENLYFSAKLCFKDKTEEELVQMVDNTLFSLGLLDRKDLRVGNALNKTISGGQRKRLNIALELIREPSILFVDEPTSGLSSRDSENVMDLLRELALKGKLIFVVIHQPSSEIYKMFDKMIILDTGGYQIYSGNPVEAVMYFKKIDAQINSEVGECPVCGNVNPELVFSIVEAQVVDEFGNYTGVRKVAPHKWEEHYLTNFTKEKVETINEAPPKSLNIPNWVRQLKIYIKRDFLAKISNKQYIILNLLEYPVLALMLSYIIRYIADPTSSVYIFRENENVSIYIFMSIIVALFFGLTVSAEEIFHDQKILKREKFLNLSKSSYLLSKIFILFALSAIQTFTFVLIGNSILGIKAMYFSYWLALFSVAAFANVLGLNISASFNSVVTIYIIIPFLMIPMMVLSGAMFSFDKLNRSVSSVDKVPLVADVMPTKWAYEALMVHQFKDNLYEQNFFEYEKEISNANFKLVYYIPELIKRLDKVMTELNTSPKVEKTKDDLLLLHNELLAQCQLVPFVECKIANCLNVDSFDMQASINTMEYINALNEYYQKIYDAADKRKNNMLQYLDAQKPLVYKYYYDNFYNDHLTDMVKKAFEKEKNKLLEYDHRLVQQTDPIFLDPRVSHKFDFRAHLYAPRKHFLGKYYDTFWFNIFVIWCFSVFFYLCLYFDLLKRLIDFPDKVRLHYRNKKS